MSTTRRSVIAIKEATTQAVTVFNDRAEVTREVQLEDTQPGLVELVVEGLTHKCDPDSIRVKPSPGCTSLTIVEVAFEVREKAVTEDGATGLVEAKKAELNALSSKMAIIKAELERTNQARALVDGYVKAQLMPNATHTAPSALADVEGLLRFHGDRCASYDAERLRLQGELSDITVAVEVAQAALERLEAPKLSRTTTSRDVTVLVNVGDMAAKSADGARMLLTYMVRAAAPRGRDHRETPPHRCNR